MKIYTKLVIDIATLNIIEETSAEYYGPIAACKGPDAQQQQLANESQHAQTEFLNNYSTLFGEQQGIVNSLNNSLSSIMSAGPNQMGFSPSETAALNTQAINATGAQYANLQQQVQASGSQATGGGLVGGLTSGAQAQLQAGTKEAAVNQALSAENQTNLESAQLGQQNYWNAVSGEQSLGSLTSPNAASSAFNSGQGTAFGEAEQIQKEQEAASPLGLIGGVISSAAPALDLIPGAGPIIGGIAGVAGGALSGNTSSMTSGGQELALGIQNEEMSSINSPSAISNFESNVFGAALP